MTQEWFKNLLTEIDRKKDQDFTGLGIIVYKDLENLPVTPMKIIDADIALPVSSYDQIVQILLKVSKLTNQLHDGFHLISYEGKLTHLSQYFSTPIIKGAQEEFQYGSRHRTALYGSYMESVLFCGICSSYEPPVLYVKGRKVGFGLE